MLQAAKLRRHHKPHLSQDQSTETQSKPDVGKAFATDRGSEAPVVQVDFKCCDDGRIIEMIEDADDSSRTLFAVYEGGRIHLTKEVQHRGQRLVPLNRDCNGLGQIRLPHAPASYRSPEELFLRVLGFINSCLELPPVYGALASYFMIYDWVADRMPMAVYLCVTGLPQSGKTTLLEVLELISRRPLLVSEITPAAMYEACSRFSPTLLADENEWDNGPSSRALRRLLRAGTSRKLIGKHRGSAAHTFGPKVLCSLELPADAALKTRCVHIPMQESNRLDLRKPSDPMVMQVADELRGALLRYRLENYLEIGPRAPAGAEHLRPRSRDMASSLAGAVRVADPQYDDFLVCYFRDLHDPETRDVLSSRQSAALAGLFFLVHPVPVLGSVQVGILADKVNEILKSAGEHFSISPRALSPVLDSLGFSQRDKAAAGKKLLLDRETVRAIHNLWHRYGSAYLNESQLILKMLSCPDCTQEGGAPSKKCAS